MRAGVTVVDPATTWIDADVTLEPDTVLEPNTLLRGTHAASPPARMVGPNCLLVDTEVGAARRGQQHDVVRRGDRPGGDGRPLHLPPPGHPARPRRQGRRLRRDEEGRASATAPRCRTCRYVGDADDRRGREHRRGHDLRQLRRRRQAPHRRSATHSFVGSDSVLVGAGADRRRRLRRGRLDHHQRRRARGAGGGSRASSATSRVGGPPPGGHADGGRGERWHAERTTRLRQQQRPGTDSRATAEGRTHELHQDHGREEADALLRPRAPRARGGGGQRARHRAHPDDGLRLRQRRDLHPLQGVGARLRRVRAAELHVHRSTRG